MNTKRAAQEERARRKAIDDVEPIVYINDWDKTRAPMSTEQKRSLRAALAERGIDRLTIEYVDNWRE